jgi:hypothetical protein
MVLILAEDDCAPDSLAFFKKEFEKLMNMTVSDFISKAKKVSQNEYEMQYVWNNYSLGGDSSHPWYELHKLEEGDKYFQKQSP